MDLDISDGSRDVRCGELGRCFFSTSGLMSTDTSLVPFRGCGRLNAAAEMVRGAGGRLLDEIDLMFVVGELPIPMALSPPMLGLERCCSGGDWKGDWVESGDERVGASSCRCVVGVAVVWRRGPIGVLCSGGTRSREGDDVCVCA